MARPSGVPDQPHSVLRVKMLALNGPPAAVDLPRPRVVEYFESRIYFLSLALMQRSLAVVIASPIGLVLFLESPFEVTNMSALHLR